MMVFAEFEGAMIQECRRAKDKGKLEEQILAALRALGVPRVGVDPSTVPTPWSPLANRGLGPAAFQLVP